MKESQKVRESCNIVNRMVAYCHVLKILLKLFFSVNRGFAQIVFISIFFFSNMTYVYNYLFKKQIIEHMRQNKIINKTSYMNLLNIQVKIVSFNINIADK